MFQFKITKALENPQTILRFDMDGVLKEVLREGFSPKGEKLRVYEKGFNGGDSTPLVSTGKFKKSFFVGESSIKSRDNREKIKSIKKKVGRGFFKPPFKDILKYLIVNL